MTEETLKLLSIDDRALTTELDRAGYKKMGVGFQLASSFGGAEKLIEKIKPDVIVISYDYEKIDALQVCSHFKAKHETKDIPVVIKSVQTTSTIRKAVMNAGADMFVEQPLPRQFFIEKIRALLEQKVRTTDRVTHGGLVTFELAGDSITCDISDLSKSGILLATDTLTLEPGSDLSLSFAIPGYKKPIRVDGTVVRRITKTEDKEERQIGYGFRFSTFHGDSQNRLERYINKSKTGDPNLTYYL